MLMNLGGSATDLPLYDQEGNLIQLPEYSVNLDSFDEAESEFNEPEFTERASTVEEADEAKKLISIVKSAISKIHDIGTDLSVSEIVNVYDHLDGRDYYSVTIFGGRNGSGIWSNYFKTMHELFLELETVFEDVWVRKWSIDSVDDVFEVEIAILPYI